MVRKYLESDNGYNISSIKMIVGYVVDNVGTVMWRDSDKKLCFFFFNYFPITAPIFVENFWEKMNNDTTLYLPT